MTHDFISAESCYMSIVVDRVPSMLAYWRADLICLFANRAYEVWFGVTPDSLIGTSLRDLLGPALFRLNEPYIRAALQGEEQTFERDVPGPDGMLRRSLAMYLPHIVDGVVKGFIVQVTPVSRLKEVEMAREAQLRELFMQASDGIFIADRQGRYTDVNEAGCHLLGYGREEILGLTIADLISQGEIEHLQQALPRLVEDNGRVHTEEWTLRRKDGVVIPVEVSARAMSDGQVVAFVRDIAEQRRVLEASRIRAEELELCVAQRTEQLRRLSAALAVAEDRERQQIARDLHDDLCQMLVAAQIRLSVLHNDEREEVRVVADGVSELIDAANRSTRSLSEQLAPPVLHRLGLSAGLEWLGEAIERNFRLKVRVDDDGQPKPLSQDARSILYRATRELLINVARHARAEEAVVKSLRQGNRIVVHVSDNGVGFDATKVTLTEGRGLGLPSVRERLSFIGGTAEIQSAPGASTVVVLSAPLTLAECGR